VQAVRAQQVAVARPRLAELQVGLVLCYAVRNYCGYLPSQFDGVSVRNNLAHLTVRPERY